jgi:hypothetical protein
VDELLLRLPHAGAVALEAADLGRGGLVLVERDDVLAVRELLQHQLGLALGRARAAGDDEPPPRGLEVALRDAPQVPCCAGAVKRR